MILENLVQQQTEKERIVIHLLLSLTMSPIIMLNKSQLFFFKMRVAVQGLRMERNRRLLWDMTKIIFNSIMTILIFGLLIGMVKQ